MKSVLIVEDNDDIRELYTEVLQGAGYPVLAAEHGQQALDILEHNVEMPGLVLLDMMMPVLDGRGFIGAVQCAPRLAGLPIVMVTATVPRAPLRGIRGVLRKPVAMHVILELAATYCAEDSQRQ